MDQPINDSTSLCAELRSVRDVRHMDTRLPARAADEIERLHKALVDISLMDPAHPDDAKAAYAQGRAEEALANAE